jgi:peptidoglycan/LPS O-acetylase OafA/YrhL
VHTSLPLPSSVRQIDGLQLLRAVAVMLVAWLHADEKMVRFAGHHIPDLGVFGVDIFFVISGFILSSIVMRERHAPGLAVMGKFLQRRLIRIYPVYWIFAFLTLARLAHTHQLFEQNYFTAFFLLLPAKYPAFPLLHEFSWTLIFEMFFYATLSVILIKTVRFATPALITVLLLLVTLGAFVDIRRPFWIFACNPILLEFAFGALLALAHPKFGRHRRIGIGMTVGGSILAIGLRTYNSPTVASGLHMVRIDSGVFERVFTFGIAAALIVGGMIFWSPALSNRLGRLFVVLGNASYSTYLVSSLGIEYCLRVLIKLGGNPFTLWKQALYDTVSVVLVLAAGWLFYDLVEWPLLRSIQARLASKSSGALSAPTLPSSAMPSSSL